jgi:hypothetical protein
LENFLPNVIINYFASSIDMQKSSLKNLIKNNEEKIINNTSGYINEDVDTKAVHTKLKKPDLKWLMRFLKKFYKTSLTPKKITYNFKLDDSSIIFKKLLGGGLYLFIISGIVSLYILKNCILNKPNKIPLSLKSKLEKFEQSVLSEAFNPKEKNDKQPVVTKIVEAQPSYAVFDSKGKAQNQPTLEVIDPVAVFKHSEQELSDIRISQENLIENQGLSIVFQEAKKNEPLLEIVEKKHSYSAFELFKATSQELSELSGIQNRSISQEPNLIENQGPLRDSQKEIQLNSSFQNFQQSSENLLKSRQRAKSLVINSVERQLTNLSKSLVINPVERQLANLLESLVINNQKISVKNQKNFKENLLLHKNKKNSNKDTVKNSFFTPKKTQNNLQDDKQTLVKGIRQDYDFKDNYQNNQSQQETTKKLFLKDSAKIKISKNPQEAFLNARLCPS